MIIINTTEHFNLIIDLLESNGNPVDGGRWSEWNREGAFTFMTKPIDFDLVRQHFTLPDTIKLNEERDSIDSANDASHIASR